jgi:hypothetical protein
MVKYGGELQPKRWWLQHEGVGLGPASAEARPFQPE